eukprot:m.176782 g.176782  ORF g.176782 m.176782 type:complete len:503 (-) comp31857_c0_seq8:929-2437(-)
MDTQEEEPVRSPDTGVAENPDAMETKDEILDPGKGTPKAAETETETAEDENETEKACRYCLGPEEPDEPEDPLISPCVCKGGQKWCHFSCLKRWQRSVLVTQPTHPAFYERDERQFVCNVCKTAFSVAPPSRKEMMQSFTGPELAALLAVGCLIVADQKTSEYMAETVRHNSHISAIDGMRHWIKGVYLITSVEEDVATDGEDLVIAINLTRPLTDVPPVIKHMSKKLHSLSSLHVGCAVKTTGLFTKKYNNTQGTIISRLSTGRLQVQLGESKKTIAIKPSNAKPLETLPEATLQHYTGGPCYESQGTSLACLSATHPDELDKANVNFGGNQGGLWVTGDLDDVCAIARVDASRTGGTAMVDTFWGDARWSRTQLLAEIARGSWGVCRAEIPDVNQNASSLEDGCMVHVTWDTILASDRLIFAEKSEMTDEDIHAETPERTQEEEDARARDQHEEMLRAQQQLRAQVVARQQAETDAIPPEARAKATETENKPEDDEPMID